MPDRKSCPKCCGKLSFGLCDDKWLCTECGLRSRDYYEENKMDKNLKKMSCGNCETGEFSIYQNQETGVLFILCDGCKSTTIVSPSKSELELNLADGSDGILCVLDET